MPSVPRTAAFLVTCLFLAGACSDDDEASPAPEPAGSATPTPATLPTAIPVTTSPVPLGDRQQARIAMPLGPDWLATSNGSLWVRTGAGTVVRLDPKTNKIEAQVTISDDSRENNCQGLGADETAVWSCAPDGDMVRIDPTTNKVAATVKAGKIDDQGQIPVAFGHAWVLAGDGSRLLGLAGDTIDVTVELGIRCQNIAATASSLWATCLTEDQVVRIDPTTRAITNRVTGLDAARFVSAASGTVWASFLGGIARIDEATARVTAVVGVFLNTQAGLFATDEELWVRDEGMFLTRVDADTGAVVEQFTVPERSGGSVLPAFGSLWATAYNDSVLFRIAI